MTLGSHQRPIGSSQTHITPLWILDALGGPASFDLDPAAADPRPWDCANCSLIKADNGLAASWTGRVFLNPPFDRREVGTWIRRLAEHGTGICLTHARCEAGWFRPIWERASGILFLDRRIKFCAVDGSEQPFNSGAPAVLASFGPVDLEVLRSSGIGGVLITIWERRVDTTRVREPAQGILDV
jgi:DNA N-6-adenine-methyltransferase (Dam)